MTLGIVAAYLALLLLLGLGANRFLRATPKDYMLASHSIGPVLLLMSLFGTTMTAFALVGSSGKAYQLGVGVYGMLASASGIVHSLCFFVVGLKLWSLGRRHGYTTQIQFFRDRLESDKVGLLLFPMLVGLVIPYLLIGVLGAGAVISASTKGTFENAGWFSSYAYAVPPWLASGGICTIVLIYVFFGGMRGTAWANTFQTAVFMCLGVLTFVTIANGIGGSDSFIDNLRAATESASKDHLSRVRVPKSVYFSFLLIPLSVAMFPHVFQHWLTARSASTFKLPIVVHPVFIMIVWVPCVLVGVWATGAGLESAKPNQVLALLVHKYSGEFLGGLLTAGILAAIMSSLDSQFLCLGTMFTHDIVLHYSAKHRFSDGQIVMMARLFIVAIVAVTFILSLFSPAGVFEMGVWCFTGFAGLFPLVIAAIYWRRLTAPGALASILVTMASWAIMFHLSGYAQKPFSFPVSPVAIAGQTVIPPLMPVVSITLFSAITLIVVSLLTKPPSEETLSKFFKPTET